MSDNFIRHLIATLATIAAFAIYFAGYAMGKRGWWLAGVFVFVVYAIIYQLVEA